MKSINQRGRAQHAKLTTPRADEILVAPLGGTCQIGSNATLYGHDGKWILVDLGQSFADEKEQPGVQCFVPDISFAQSLGNNLLGVLITHAHEDHIGALPRLAKQLGKPILCSRFAGMLIREKLREARIESQVELREIAAGKPFELGPFQIEPIAMTHSTAEPMAFALRTRAGTLLHTGDWKFDPDPLVGPACDIEALRRLGNEGVLAMVCDSTNAGVETAAPSEAMVRQGLIEAFKGRRGAIAVAAFASHVGRVRAICEAAAHHGRRVALIGRSLLRSADAAKACGYFAGLPDFLDEDQASREDPENLVYMVTGTQGEERAALGKLAFGTHPKLSLGDGDTVLMSARCIPGNEEKVERILEALRSRGVEIVTPGDVPAEFPIHASGHPGRPDLIRMYEIVKPRIAIPVHGTIEHLETHARLARTCGVDKAIVPEDLDLIRISAADSRVISQVKGGILAWDGKVLRSWNPANAALIAAAAEREAAWRSNHPNNSNVSHGPRHASRSYGSNGYHRSAASNGRTDGPVSEHNRRHGPGRPKPAGSFAMGSIRAGRPTSAQAALNAVP